MKFNVVLADPPWSWKAYSDKGMGRSAEVHYPTMKRSDLLTLPVKEVASKESALILWTTSQDEDFAISEVMPAWGYQFKTSGFIWAKTRKDLGVHFRRLFKRIERGEEFDPLEFIESCFITSKGYYSRKQSERCLLGTTKGVPSRMSRGVKELIFAPRDIHSAKPSQQYERIESLFSGPYLELFGRSLRPGWTVIGNDIDGRDIRDSLFELTDRFKEES